MFLLPFKVSHQVWWQKASTVPMLKLFASRHIESQITQSNKGIIHLIIVVCSLVFCLVLRWATHLLIVKDDWRMEPLVAAFLPFSSCSQWTQPGCSWWTDGHSCWWKYILLFYLLFGLICREQEEPVVVAEPWLRLQWLSVRVKQSEHSHKELLVGGAVKSPLKEKNNACIHLQIFQSVSSSEPRAVWWRPGTVLRHAW